MTTHGSHAVVLGAGMAGLLHAVPLAERFDRVTLVDRDVLTADAEDRRGVPQGSHVHLLVPGGVERLARLLPGVLDDLAAHGAHTIAAPEWRFHMGGGQLALEDPDLRIVGGTRPMIEAVVRERVRRLAATELLDGWSARALDTTEDRATVTGVRLRSTRDPDEELHLSADLVLDATGRGSPSSRWLDELGEGDPEEDRLTVDVHYTSRLFRRGEADLDGCRHVMVDVPPQGDRGGVALAVEGDRWLVSLIGMGRRPPTDLGDFVAEAATLHTDDVHRIVRDAEPLGEATEHAFPAFSWHRYDHLSDLPERFVVTGDAVCSFDPRFGQGMTVAAAEALELGRLLDEGGLDSIGVRHLEASRPIVQDAWDLATGAVLSRPEIEGPRPLAWRLTNAYLQRLLRVAHDDPEVAAAFIRVVGMLERPQSLTHPLVAWRVLRGGTGSTDGGSAHQRTPRTHHAHR